MAGIFKAIGGGNSHACANLEKYLTKLEKVNGNEVIGINCDPYTFDSDFIFDRAKYSIDKDARAYLHYSLSYRDSDGLSHEEILEQARKLVEGTDKFKGHKVAIICHSDKPSHPHVHIVVNAVNTDTGRKLAFDKRDLAALKERLIALDREKGLEPEQKNRRGTRNQSMKGYKTLEKGELGDKNIWKVAIKNAVIENIDKAKSKEEFIKLMENKGYMVKWEEKNKNITIIDSEGNKRRLSNIEKEYPGLEGKLSKESLLETFKLNEIKGQGAGLQSLADKYQVDIKAIEKSLEVKLEGKLSKESLLETFKLNEIKGQGAGLQSLADKYQVDIKAIEKSLEVKEKKKEEVKEKTKVKEETEWTRKLTRDRKNDRGMGL